MEAFAPSPTSPHRTPGRSSPTGISVQFDRQRIFLGQVDSQESTTGGRIDTVTVVAYPSGVFSTLPQSHELSTTPAEDQTFPPSPSKPSFSTAPSVSNAIDTPLSGPSTSPSSSSLSSSQPTATVAKSLSVQDSITGSFSSSSFRFHPSPAISLGVPHDFPNSSGTRSSGSNLANLDPPVYVGIILGCIAAFAILCATVAWCIRVWHSRRRRKNSVVEVPWANSQTDDFNGLETGGSGHTDWHANSRLLPGNIVADSGRQAGIRHWITSRDVGEPRPSDSYGDFPRGHHHDPNPKFFSGGVGGNPGAVVKHYQAPHNRQSLASGPDRMGGEYDVGTPREENPVPRYLSLKGDALELPWTRDNSERAPPPPPPRSVVERLRRASQPARQTLARSMPSDHSVQRHPLAPGPVQVKQEGWAGSITSNLVNAFNAVAANIHPFKGDGEGHDLLTPKPSRRGSGRKSTLPDSSSDSPMEHSALESSSSSFPPVLFREPSRTSAPWTLEEFADGTGFVHLHISPSKRGLGDLPSSINESPSRDHDTLHSSPSRSSIPLVASDTPQAAFLKPEISHHFRAQPDDQVSRQSSDSQRSSSASVSNNTNFVSTEPLNLTKRRKSLNAEGKKGKQSPLAGSPRRPSLLSYRLPSASTSSATSWNSFASLTTKNQVIEALRARKRTPYSKELDLRSR